MRATIHNYLEAAKQRREENGEKGFSLIELIVVIVIIGILAAIAIPIFSNIQKTANDAAAQSAASNAATTAAIEGSKTYADTAANVAAVTGLAFTELKKAPVSNVVVTKYDGTLASICVTATVSNGTQGSWTAGPGASADHKTCP